MNRKDIENQIREIIEEKEKERLNLVNENGTPIPLNIAKDIIKEYNIITMRDNEDMLFYNNGIYHKNSESKIKEEAQKRVPDITKHHKNEVTELIKGLTYIDREELSQNRFLIHLKNGIYNLETGEFSDFSKDIISITQLPVKYNPDADCPKIKKFINEVVNEDNVKLVQEMFGYCLYKDYPFSRAFMLLGSGSNGKSTLLDLLVEFLGRDNIATPSLQDLLKDRFAKILLYGKLANIHADLSTEKLENTGTFKMLTGGDMIYGQKKFQDPLKFRNYAKLIYSANELPRTEDRTDAFFRRWIVIDFPNQFEEGKEGTDSDLPYSIIDEDEMSGLFNWAVEGLKRILENNGFSHTKSRDDIKRKWIMKTDSLRAFLRIACKVEEGKYIGKEDFYEVYRRFCDENNIYCVSKTNVTKRLVTILPRVSLFRPLIKDEQVRCWKNLTLTDTFIKENDYIHDIQLFSIILNKSNNNSNINSHKNLDKLSISNYTNTNTTRVLELMKSDNISYFELEEKAKEKGVKEDEFMEIIDKLKSSGKIFEPRSGYLKKM